MSDSIRRSTAAVLVASVLSLACAAALADVYAPATQLKRPDLQVMGCPRGATWDPRNGGECWTCSEYEVRTLEPIDSARACITAPGDDLKPATMLERDKQNCTGDSYFDPVTASCWVCPNGGTPDRLQSANGSKACFKRIDKQERKADFHSRTKSIAHSCPSGTFANVGSRRCHSCPDGWNHDPLRKVEQKGVCFKPAYTVNFAATHQKTISLTCKDGFYDPIRGGSCWTCPSGYQRGAAAVDTSEACFRPALPEEKPATRLGSKPIDLEQAARGTLTLGCSNQGKDAFFDPKGAGSCWRCPRSHPKRSLFDVDDRRACMSAACGAEGGRPCMVWERIPSCDKGLVEDFTNNTCRQSRELACESYVKTLNAFREAIETANETAGAVQDAVLDRVPGRSAAMKALEVTVGQFQEHADKVTENLDFSEVTGHFERFAIQNPELMSRMVSASEMATRELDAIKDIFTDPRLICGKDLEHLAWRLGNLGFDRTLDPQVFHIPVGAVGSGSPHPFSLLAGLSGQQLLYATNTQRLVRPHHRMVFDASVSFPFSKKYSVGAEVNATGTLGLQFATNFKDSHGLFFTHGVTLTGAKTQLDLGKAKWDHFGGVDWAIGYQYRGNAIDECSGDDDYSWGIPVKVGGFLGIGFNTTCPYAFSGFTVTVANTQNFAALAEMVSSPAGPQPLPVTESGWRNKFPGVQFSLGSGWEGAATIGSTEQEDRATP